MPEAPEIKAMVDNLRRISKKVGRINKIVILGDKTLNLQKETYKLFKQIIPFEFGRISSHGKLIIFELKNSQYLIQSSGLSGIWGYSNKININTIRAADTPIFALIGTNGTLIYFDQRHFSKFKIVDAAGLRNKLQKIGVDILKASSGRINITKLAEDIKIYFPKLSIAAALMQQKIISGIGNKMKSEILYRAKIYPGKKVSLISAEIITKILRIGIKLAEIYYKIQKRKSYFRMPAGREEENIDNNIDNINNKNIIHKFYIKDDDEYTMIYAKKVDKYGNKVATKTFEDGRTTYFINQ